MGVPDASSENPEDPRSQSTRDALILKHLPAVHTIARHIQKRLPAFIVLEELISAGTIGLIAAIDHYEPARGVKLSTYAEYKIRGAILDSLRAADWAPRQARKQVRQIQQAICAAEQRWNRSPTEEEIATELGQSIEFFRKWRAKSRTLEIGEWEFRSWHEGERQSLVRAVPATGESPLERVERIELMGRVVTAIDVLPSREKMLLKLHFLQDKPLHEVAEILKLHPSRISQLKMHALRSVREYVACGLGESCQLAGPISHDRKVKGSGGEAEGRALPMTQIAGCVRTDC
jgi:RNA polymerase sigma factor for flagellar operon FliA